MSEEVVARPKPPALQRILPWVVAAACFAFLYFFRLGPAAAKRDLSVPGYLLEVFQTVDWGAWLPLMMRHTTSESTRKKRTE